ncbi:MAG: response regulator [Xanthomonadales bacterium]|nr:response regulator [Xanthomonadales bacterium]
MGFGFRRILRHAPAAAERRGTRCRGAACHAGATAVGARPRRHQKSRCGAGTGRAPLPARAVFVDDLASIRPAYRQPLERNGYDCDVAGSIAEAFAWRTSASYDLFILDYFLPDGSGDELCRRLKALPATAGAAVAMITGTYREDIIPSRLEAGARRAHVQERGC